MEKGFKILEHPADMGIEAFGNNLKEAFEQAAVGLISIILDPSNVENIKTKKVQIYATGVETLTPISITAIINGENFNNSRHTTKMDVKAITYHQILVQESEDGGLIRVYLDI
jgi:SHS2 domain-containing protein